MNQKHRKILSACFAASLFLHAIAAVFLQRYSLWFSSPPSTENNTAWLSLVDKTERDQILKTAFETVAQEKETLTTHQLKQEEVPPLTLKSPVMIAGHELLHSIFFQNPSFPIDDFLIAKPFLPTFSVPSESFNLLDHLPKDLIIPVAAKQKPHFVPQPAQSTVTLAAAPPTIQTEAPIPKLTYSESLDLPLTAAPQMAKAPNMIPLPSLPVLPTLAELDTSSYSDSFDADLVFLPREEGGYIFALTLIPKPELAMPRLKQHFTFLIDKSNSIQQGRLHATKGAIHKALGELSSEDTFNIVAFDSKIEKMSPYSLPCVGKSFAIAEEFLEKIQLGSFFSSTDLMKPLLTTVPSLVPNDELHTVILLTDGETLVKKTAQKALLHDWTQYNRGRVALYALGLNSDSHMATLDTATVFNKGKLSNAPTNRGLKRKLLKMIKNVQNPIAKNIACKAISRAPQAKVQIYPKSTQLPPLYVDQPYVILGESETLDDFILFVQGRLKDRWLNIKKTISFLNARKGNKSLKQEWALQCAYDLYERYVRDDDPKHLAEAATLLEPFDCQTAFR